MYFEDKVQETGFSFSGHVPGPPERRPRRAPSQDPARRHADRRRPPRALPDPQHLGRRRPGPCLFAARSPASAWRSSSRPTSRSTAVSSGCATPMPASSSTCVMDVAELLANPPVLDNGWRPRTPRVEIDRMATLRVWRPHPLGAGPRHLADRGQGRDRSAPRTRYRGRADARRISARCTAGVVLEQRRPIAASPSTSSFPSVN